MLHCIIYSRTPIYQNPIYSGKFIFPVNRGSGKSGPGISGSDLAEAYVTKKGYLKQGEYHSGEAVLHAENVSTSENQLTILTFAYYLLGHCRLKLGKTADAGEAATAARNCLQELSFLNDKVTVVVTAVKTGTDTQPCSYSYISISGSIATKINILSAACTSPLTFLPPALESCTGLEAVYIHHMLANTHKNTSTSSAPGAALKSARAAQRIAEGSSDVALQADASRFLARIYLESTGHGCVEEGLGLLREAIALYTTQFTGLHHVTIETYDLLINALIKQEQYGEAIEELRATKEAKVLKFGEYSKQLAAHHKLLGSVFLLVEKTKEALVEFKKCLKILAVVQSAPTEMTIAIKKTVQSLEANKETRPMFKLYSKV
eukprot:sb/3465718/